MARVEWNVSLMSVDEGAAVVSSPQSTQPPSTRQKVTTPLAQTASFSSDRRIIKAASTPPVSATTGR